MTFSEKSNGFHGHDCPKNGAAAIGDHGEDRTPLRYKHGPAACAGDRFEDGIVTFSLERNGPLN
jgi:hypothetical protein